MGTVAYLWPFTIITYTMRLISLIMSTLFFIASSVTEKSKISKVVVNAGSNTFKCSFVLVHSNHTLVTKESSISCTPRNKAANVKALNLFDDTGCSFTLSFKIKKGKGQSIGGSVECPTVTTEALINSTSEVGSQTVGPTTTVGSTTVGSTPPHTL